MSKTETITCPVCGKQHQVKRIAKVNALYLNMTPQYKLQIALQRAKDGYDYSARAVHIHYFTALRTKKTFFDDSFVYTSQHKLLELNRQLGNFAEAERYYQSLWKQCKSEPERKFLQYEKQLIDAHKSDNT